MAPQHVIRTPAMLTGISRREEVEADCIDG
jgi:hypothetical protein